MLRDNYRNIRPTKPKELVNVKRGLKFLYEQNNFPINNMAFANIAHIRIMHV
jgi:hypothetical protein